MQGGSLGMLMNTGTQHRDHLWKSLGIKGEVPGVCLPDDAEHICSF